MTSTAMTSSDVLPAVNTRHEMMHRQSKSSSSSSSLSSEARLPANSLSSLHNRNTTVNVCHTTILYHTIPYCIIQYHTVSYNTILYHTILYHTIPYCIIQYHTVSYNTILYHTIPVSYTHLTLPTNREV